ncbi:unnamed protein product [marine sediment metagenome]|uniref:Uncharacterized protein n=1 Tax=marine sediment metagenome TaxID=412755 RepID=X1PZT4_9ZZZZ
MVELEIGSETTLQLDLPEPSGGSERGGLPLWTVWRMDIDRFGVVTGW